MSRLNNLKQSPGMRLFWGGENGRKQFLGLFIRCFGASRHRSQRAAAGLDLHLLLVFSFPGGLGLPQNAAGEPPTDAGFLNYGFYFFTIVEMITLVRHLSQ
jgi:hypothetical protein